MKKHTRRMLIMAFKTSGAVKIFGGYLVWFFISAIPIWIFEPHIKTYADSLWFCFASATTIGYGDCYAVTLPGRIITVCLSVYSIGVVAVFTAVIASFFTDMARIRASDSARQFVDELEHLPQLSKEELEDLSERVKKFQKEYRDEK